MINLTYAEVVVNIPIRRTFSRRHEVAPPPPEPDIYIDSEPIAPVVQLHAQSKKIDTSAPNIQTYHYHLPPELEPLLQPGHLVWIPFGRQEVQGIVLRLSDHAPVSTKPILRLARTEPILNESQIDLAIWLANYYVAPLSEAAKLFIPPGMLTKQDGSRAVRAKRELQVELAIDPAAIPDALSRLARDSQQATVLSWLLEHPEQQLTLRQLQQSCQLKSDSALKTLLKKAWITLMGEQVQLALGTDEAQQILLQLRGVDKYQLVLERLAEAQMPLWKSDLYTQVHANLQMLRTLQRAGLILLTEHIRFRDPLAGRTYPQTSAPPFTSEQAAAWKKMVENGFVTNEETTGTTSTPRFLLHGVTGSGKTEIYLKAIQQTLARDRQAIVLVPEIALTPQTVARFAGRFPGRATVIHSGLNQGERYDVWRHIRAGQYDIVVGPRSALFAPLDRLGLIIIDEEHESSYKQNAESWGSFTIFYDARKAAYKLAELTNSALIYGSATPSLEAYYEALQGEFTILEMPHRVMGHRVVEEAADETIDEDIDGGLQTGVPRTEAIYAEMPPVEVVDMRQELRAGNRHIFSRSLKKALQTTLDAGEQAILFLNRRGTRTFIMCRDCGHVQQCERCEIPLTYHENIATLVCHHCNQRYPIPEICPESECQSKRIKYFGSGTQRIEELVQQIAPEARMLRWDADTTNRKGSHEAILRSFANHEADILIGTQMIAKGLDLPLVTMVGVIAADVGLHLPDFRSGERTFQLLTQVAGRAGRGELGGRVVIQTYNPQHYAIQAAAQHDYASFYRQEMLFRRENGYPPVKRMARLVYWEKKQEKAQETATKMAATLRHRLTELEAVSDEVSIMGPLPAFFARFGGYYRWQILMRAPDPTIILRGLDIPFGWRVDVDPVSVL